MTPRAAPSIRPAPGVVDPDDFVNTWVGVPFKWDGRDQAGVDCWGLVWRFYSDCLGVVLPDWTVGDRGAAFAEATFAAQMADHWRGFDGPRDFALVMCPQGRQAAHVGVVWRGAVFHSQSPRGVVWEALGRFTQARRDCRFGEYVDDLAAPQPEGGQL